MGPRNPNRNAQFENIARLKKEYLKAGLPVISMDTKKKELLGNFYRDGKIDTQETIETNDHDFGSAGAGTVIPHGLYDVGRNQGFIHLNTSHDTSELACDSLAAWWDQQGRADYPQAKKLLVLCDGGGSNSATMYLFKEDLQKLANRLGIEIRVAHYPPYCSKYNPIEHRLFPHVTRACRGVIFHTLETVRYYMAKAETTTGLKVKVSILDKVYETGRKYAAGFKKTMKIVFDKFLPKWNYRAVPEPEYEIGKLFRARSLAAVIGSVPLADDYRGKSNISAGYRTACRRHDCKAGHPLGKRPRGQMGCRPRGYSVQFPSSSRSLSRIFCGSVTGGNTPLVRRLTIRIR